VGTEVTVTSKKNGTMKWIVVESHTPPDEKLNSKANCSYRLKGFSISDHRKSEGLAYMFLELSFVHWKAKVDKMKLEVSASNCNCRKFLYEKFLIGMALLLGAADFSRKGVVLFRRMKMMTKTLSSGQQSLLLHTFSNTWLLAVVRSFEVFCLQFMPM
jgi:hypothetical protein